MWVCTIMEKNPMLWGCAQPNGISLCIVNSKTSFESMTYVSVYSGAFPGNAVQTLFDKKLS